MAIPIGTTSRQVGLLVRWTHLAVILVGLLTWWWPDYSTWGALIGGLIASLLLWFCWQTVSVDRTVPGNPVHLALLIPAAILTYHLANTGLGRGSKDMELLGGSLNASMLLHLAMLALCVMLSQSLLAKTVANTYVVRACGAVMIGGGILAGFHSSAEPVVHAMSLIGFAGAALWLEPLWRPSISIAQQGFSPPAHQAASRLFWLLASAGACGLLAWNSPGAAVLASVGTGLTLVVASVVFSRSSRRLLLVGTVLVVAGGLSTMLGAQLPKPLAPDGPLLGLGEEAFGQAIMDNGRVLQAVSASDSGVQVLHRTIGRHGTILTICGLAACLLGFLIRARRDHPGDKARCVSWTVASLLCAAAMLGRGGMFIPAVVLAMGLTWGLAPEAAGRASSPRPGVIVLVLLGAMMVLMGVARSNGLLVWSANTLWSGQGGDKRLHAVFGMLLAMAMAWLLGSRDIRRGLGAILLACLIGGAGEVVQYFISTGRSVEWTDWVAHAIGSVAAAVPYLLCVGARQCESTDAIAANRNAIDPYSG